MKDKATNFDDSILAKINSILKFVLENEHSDFYRKKYGKNTDFYPLKSYEDFQRIPFLTKDDFREIDVYERTFIPEKEIQSFAFSSGTTSKKPVAIARTKEEERFNKLYLNNEIFQKIGMDTLFILLNPTSGPLRKYLKSKRLIVAAGNIYNIPLSCQILIETGAQGIVTTPSRLLEISKILKEKNFDFGKIKWIVLGMETCVELALKKIRQDFPNAVIRISYGNSEVGGRIGTRCEHLDKNDDPSIFHPGKRIIEIVDENGNVLEMGKTGEIVHTDISKKAQPMMRYKLGDVGKLEKRSCPCGEKLHLTLEGRSGTDYLKTEEFILSTRMIAKALEKNSNLIEPKFQIHIKKKSGDFYFKINLEQSSQNNDLNNSKKIIKRSLIEKFPFMDNLEINWTYDWGTTTRKIQSILYEKK